MKGHEMRAVVYEHYGPPDVLQLREIEKPIPKDNEVLIKVHATTVTSGDRRVRSLDVPAGFGLMSRLLFGITKPRKQILGTEIAGEIESVGKDVDKFKVGDQVFAFAGAGMGCYVEYKCMAQDGAVALKPSNLTFDQAAALSFGGSTACDFFRRGKLRSGESILVNGASGGVGSAAVQLARHFGAEVTGVCSAANFEMVKSLGATHVIDYASEDFTKNGKTYDVIMDTMGTAPFSRIKDSLRKGGRFLLVMGKLTGLLTIPWSSLMTGMKIVGGPAAERPEDLQFLAKLAQEGKFTPFIDRRYPFDQIAEAHRYVDTGRKRGNVVITLV